ncbi:MAG: hypothetical protein Q7R69_01850 [bacterium]|nr:hypothetical protein [bacterium]
MVEVLVAVLLVMSAWSFVGANAPPLEEVQVISRKVSTSENLAPRDFKRVLNEQEMTLYITAGCKQVTSSAVINGDGTAIVLTTRCAKR